jgi:hypothetical protein
MKAQFLPLLFAKPGLSVNIQKGPFTIRIGKPSNSTEGAPGSTDPAWHLCCCLSCKQRFLHNTPHHAAQSPDAFCGIVHLTVNNNASRTVSVLCPAVKPALAKLALAMSCCG